MRSRTVIFADNGKILTDGVIYGKQIFLAEGEYDFNYHEISEEEYQEILKKQEEETKQELGIEPLS